MKKCNVCEVETSELAICEGCKEEFCDDCQAPFLGPPNPTIDFPFCSTCFEIGGTFDE